MPLYELRCRDCGTTAERFAPISQGKGSTNCSCGGVLRRVFTAPQVTPAWTPHFNHSVGRFCATPNEFRDALKQGEEKMAKALPGMNPRYTEVSPSDVKFEQNEDQAKAFREKGITEKTKTIFTPT